MKIIWGTACAVFLSLLGLLRWTMPSEPAPLAKLQPPSRNTEPPPAPARESDSILSDNDADRRHARLRAWADGIATSRIKSLLEEIQHDESPLARAELRQALLFSWTSRDLAAVARWFGTLEPDYELHQEARDQLVLALLQCDPAEVLPVLQIALPVNSAQELYGPYFRAWAATAPEASAEALRQLADSSESKDAVTWHDLISQVAAQWMQTDPKQALAWVWALPESAAKTRAELQTSYRWTELDPHAASSYAAEKNNLQLIHAVAAKWAEASPRAAAEWAGRLTSEVAQSRALNGVGTTWAHSAPFAAAAYASKLGESPQRATFATAVVAAWASSDPHAAARWVQTLPFGESRDHAMEALAESSM